jgi:hypothetical protein
MNTVEEDVRIPFKNPELQAHVIALHKGKEPGSFHYIQAIRQGTLRAVNRDPEKTEVARIYHANEQRYFPLLASKIKGTVDAILSPPSRLPEQSEPYRNAIAELHPSAVDLTSRFNRTGPARAGEGAEICDVFKGLSYNPDGREKNIQRLVICDDTLNNGTTAAAIVKLLREHGLASDCEVIIACPL